MNIELESGVELLKRLQRVLLGRLRRQLAPASQLVVRAAHGKPEPDAEDFKWRGHGVDDHHGHDHGADVTEPELVEVFVDAAHQLRQHSYVYLERGDQVK